MKLKKIGLLVILMAGLFVVGISSQAIAGAGIEPPPAGAVFSGPEIWGVVVIYCGPGVGDDIVTVRFKRVVDCEVETEAEYIAGGALGCPATADDALGQSLPPYPQTEIFGQTGKTPYTTLIKNFRVEGEVVSFDAQFKFWAPGP
jgi:hypothetical protein